MRKKRGLKYSLDKQFLINEYNNKNKSLTQISKELKIPFATLYHYFRNIFHIPIRSIVINWRLKEILTKEFLIQEYVIKKRIMRDIAKELKCSVVPIRKYLKLYNVPIRKEVWNKNLTKETDERVAKYGRSGSKTLKGTRTGKNSPSFGIAPTEETRRKISLSKGGTGIPYEYTEYGSEFDSDLKEQVRLRDRYKCRICGCSQLENGQQLDCHHIDYNKKNTTLKNLVALCVSCHRKTNSNRQHWLSYFCKLVLSK